MVIILEYGATATGEPHASARMIAPVSGGAIVVRCRARGQRMAKGTPSPVGTLPASLALCAGGTFSGGSGRPAHQHDYPKEVVCRCGT